MLGVKERKNVAQYEMKLLCEYHTKNHISQQDLLISDGLTTFNCATK